MEDFDFDYEDFDFEEESDRCIENDETLAPSLHRLPWQQVCKLPATVAEKYSDVYVNFTEQTHHGIRNSDGAFVEIPRAEWMQPETYRNWLANNE